MTEGRVHSIQSLGTVDGPGVRFVVFMQGCCLRCACCHNPDTHSLSGGAVYTPDEIYERATHYKEYFGKDGGITLSGGEPLLQADFAYELFSLCKAGGIDTCLDTSGVLLDSSVRRLLEVTDRVLLDIKYTDDGLYKEHVGMTLGGVLSFLDYLDSINMPTVIRQVIIPTLNDSEENALRLKEIADAHKCVEKIELLPFKKICQTKYDALGIPFPLAHIDTPSAETMERLNRIIK